ncbi:hypothetical protein PoB_001880500 [Plakobranchus ocellatus]|uniref:Uncharacterized protein n=1 Tax=Plakobranchus ocellatus TaxID=259542 RepID=A0AAV3Z9U7_9GAST|nr:hypothetical protein PoB_001880500 [Plakobranchus ocellatus]
MGGSPVSAAILTVVEDDDEDSGCDNCGCEVLPELGGWSDQHGEKLLEDRPDLRLLADTFPLGIHPEDSVCDNGPSLWIHEDAVWDDVRGSNPDPRLKMLMRWMNHVDDLLVHKPTWEDHVRSKAALQEATAEQFYLKRIQCIFGARKIDVLGHQLIEKVIVKGKPTW